jgi:hypothetical protein
MIGRLQQCLAALVADAGFILSGLSDESPLRKSDS